eukprot:13126115-Alexandrium_andersonii.AAC.1
MWLRSGVLRETAGGSAPVHLSTAECQVASIFDAEVLGLASKVAKKPKAGGSKPASPGARGSPTPGPLIVG